MFSPPSWYLRWNGLLIAILSSLFVSGLITDLRHLGYLEEIELFAYDYLIRLRAQKGPDPRILLVAIDDDDVTKLNSDKVSDRYLTKALENLEKYQPRVIGIDIFRDVPIGEGRKELLDYINRKYEPLEGKIKPIVFACALPSKKRLKGIDPPPVIDRDSSVGFVNLETDTKDILGQEIVRRFSIASIPAPHSTQANKASESLEEIKAEEKGCYVPFSLGFLTALSYLEKEKINVQRHQADGFFQLRSVIFEPPGKRAGSYQNLNEEAYQEFIDYWYRNPVDRISLSEVLEEKIQPERVKDKVILIGYTTNDDIHQTPYGTQPGVLIHGWVVSQILSNVLDGRPRIWYFSEPIEWLWIGAWGLVGGIIAWKFRSNWLLCLTEGSALVILFGTSFILMTRQGWVPLIPPALTLVGAAVASKSILSVLKQSGSLTFQPSATFLSLENEQSRVEPTMYPSLSLEKEGTRVEPVSFTLPLDADKTKVEAIEHLPKLDSDKTKAEPIKFSSDPDPDKTKAEPINSPPLPTTEKKEYLRLDPLEGRIIDESNRYLIKKQLGVGGMSRVYLASDNKLLGKEVAIKIMINYSSIDNHNLISLIKRFEREIRVISSLKSPNIVQILDFGIVTKGIPFEGLPFYVMEYLVGKTLRQRIEQAGGLSVNEAIPIMIQICIALEEAHHNKIIHRDLKPDNIFLVSRGALGEQVKVLDFGIAKIVEPDSQQQTQVTVDGSFIGTYQYASPEQCSGNYDIDQRSDIYSLGLIFYEMLSGTNPYNIDSTKTTGVNWAVSHVTRKPLSLKSQKRAKNLPVKLEAMVMKCLSKNPSERFDNINQIEEALKEIISRSSSGQ